MMQNYSSAMTSINSRKLPAGYKVMHKMFENGEISHVREILDYGCGRYVKHISADAMNYCDIWNGYDLNWYSNKEALLTNKNLTICSNVLNVIDSDDVIDDIMLLLGHISDTVIFTVYEGNKSGVGKVTKNDCYQRNEKLSAYVKRAENLGLNVTCKYGAMIVRC